ncbi:unnamed protein product [Protopolystoma xenopodis]|uniref:Uncharacterized protein n=1 Tax=Protopolystoma xenopodis TaxID=117903 RepID=A0A3S5BMK5_9PLAT|nr:unnamed protein product [Protopolystoma xenopodis]
MISGSDQLAHQTCPPTSIVFDHMATAVSNDGHNDVRACSIVPLSTTLAGPIAQNITSLRAPSAGSPLSVCPLVSKSVALPVASSHRINASDGLPASFAISAASGGSNGNNSIGNIASQTSVAFSAQQHVRQPKMYPHSNIRQQRAHAEQYVDQLSTCERNPSQFQHPWKGAGKCASSY